MLRLFRPGYGYFGLDILIRKIEQFGGGGRGGGRVLLAHLRPHTMLTTANLHKGVSITVPLTIMVDAHCLFTKDFLSHIRFTRVFMRKFGIMAFEEHGGPSHCERP